jgi:hypothetical protein
MLHGTAVEELSSTLVRRWLPFTINPVREPTMVEVTLTAITKENCAVTVAVCTLGELRRY